MCDETLLVLSDHLFARLQIVSHGLGVKNDVSVTMEVNADGYRI